MNKKFTVFLALLLFSSAVSAHRLNEYLEATTISLSPEKVFIELRLTPGIDMAATLVKSIDLNRDNHISKVEEQIYLSALNHDLSLKLDGRTTKFNLISCTFPTIEYMKKGIGDIIIQYDAKIEQYSSTHQLKFKNAHYSAFGVYLVNCLLPADAHIHVINQTRNTNQSFYQLDFTTNYVQQVTSLDQRQSLEKTNFWALIRTFFVHGIRHILTGYDHLLFLCALVLGAVSLWDLIKIVTAFTIAHSITLTLATLGYAHLPEYIVELLISASIVFVAIQNIFWPKMAGGYNRLAVAFFFGLFHGLGFAGGLLAIMHAMPANLIICAILGFSLGVEAGNQLVLLPLYGTLQLLKRAGNNAAKNRRLLIFQRCASGTVAVAGIYYTCVILWAYI